MSVTVSRVVDESVSVYFIVRGLHLHAITNYQNVRDSQTVSYSQ